MKKSVEFSSPTMTSNQFSDYICSLSMPNFLYQNSVSWRYIPMAVTKDKCHKTMLYPFRICAPLVRLSGFELLEWCGLVIRSSRSGFFFLGQLSHQCFCGEHETRDRSRILERVAGHLRRIDDARFHQVDILAGGNVVAFVP